MPLGSVRLLPGVNKERTETLNEAGISTSQLIRFKDQLVQKIGGWVKFYQFALSSIPRALHAWQDLNDVSRLAVGAEEQLAIITETGGFSDITPQTLTTNFTVDFDTTIGSTTVRVTDSTIANPTVFDSVYFNTPISVGGVILSGLYQITLVLSATEFNITAATAATASVTAGGAVPSFATTNQSSQVTVTFSDHGLVAGDTINFPIETIVGGLTIFGTYTVVSAPTSSTFVIQINSSATSTTTGSMNGGAAQLVYYIAIGPPATISSYGSGTYGSGGYGTGSVFTALTGNPITADNWTLDNWGEILLACPFGGGLYTYQPSGGFSAAAIIPSGPPFNGGLFVAQPAQILVAWGSTSSQNIGTDRDPLLVRWSDQLDYTVWAASTANQAGSYRLATGSKIVGALQGPQFSLLWTDLDVYAMQYIGFPLVFGFNKLGSNCGLIAMHAATQMGGTIFWMGNANFFVLSGGGASPIPCTVWDEVFQDLDAANSDKCWAWSSSTFNEAWWFYPSSSGSLGECDSYVKFNVQTGEWDYGSLRRSCGIDESVLGRPIAAIDTGLIYSHETGENNDGQPITSSFETGYFMLNEGNDIGFVDWVLPDMRWGQIGGAQTASIQITFYGVMFPGDTPITYGPYTMTQATQYINTRIRARQISMKIESSDLDSFWRLGRIRYRFQPDGRY